MDRRRYKEPTEYSRLPKDYQEVEYLESTGTQYISVPFVRNISRKSDFHIKTKITRTGKPAAYTGYYGINYDGEPYTSLRLINGSPSNVLMLYTLTSASAGSRTISDAGTTFVLECTKQFIDVNGVRYAPSTVEGTNRTSSAFYLFAQDPGYISPCRIYYLSFTYDDDEYNFIPCYRKSDNKPGMYDMVNDVFYTNVGTGEFLVGSSTTANIDCDTPGELGPDNPLKAKFIGYKYIKESLPEDYQEVEYLESTGTQYIAMPFVRNISRKSDFHIKTKITRTAMLSDYTGYYGINYDGEPYTSLRLINGINLFVYTLTSANTGRTSIPNIGAGTTFVLECTKQFIDVNGVRYAPSTVEGTNRTSSAFYLFAQDPGYISPCRIYYLSFTYDDDEYNFIPCYRKSDGVAGMYDTVNDVFYTNAGTGEFLVGQDVPNKIIVDRLWDYKRGFYNPETGEFTKL